jgi:hypothetical protein
MANPTVSADCTVTDGATVFSSYGGVDVTEGNTIQLALASTTEVNRWSIDLIAATDGTPVPLGSWTPPTTVGGVAQFTAPTLGDGGVPEAGVMMVFRSIVNDGMAVSDITVYVVRADDVLETWQASTAYNTLGTKVKPTSSNANGHFYVLIATGTSAATEPAWSAEVEAGVRDGANAIWQEAGTLRNLSLAQERGLALGGPLGSVNVQRYGGGQMIVDGVLTVPITGPTRDDQAFAEAIAALRAMGGGELHVPAGRYVLTRQLGPLPSGSTLRGDGTGEPTTMGTGTTIDFYTPGLGIYAFDAAGANGGGGITIRDVWLRNVIPTWAPGWTVSVGQLMTPRSANGIVYECTTAGTTQAAADGEPRWNTRMGSTTTENVGQIDETPIWTAVAATGASVPTWTADTFVAVNMMVAPRTANGQLFVCTQAGQTGSTEPTWTTNLGDAITDNGAVWTPRHGQYATGKTVRVGDRCSDATQACIYEVTAIENDAETGTTTTEPIWTKEVGKTYLQENPGTVTWTEVARIGSGDANDGFYQLTTWHPSWVVVAGQACVPTVPNGRYYVCTTAGTTGTTEPDCGSAEIAIPGNWPFNAAQVALRSGADKYTVSVADNTAVWEEAGPIPVGVSLVAGSNYLLDRVVLTGWQMGVLAVGVNGARVHGLVDSGSNQLGAGEGGSGSVGGVVPPSPSSVGVMVGGNAFATGTVSVTVSGSAFNAALNCIWSYADVNHAFRDNIGELGDFMIFGRVTGPNGSLWENNSLSDAQRFTIAPILCDGRPANLSVRGNFFVAKSLPALVFLGTGPIGFELTQNNISAGVDDPITGQQVFAVQGARYITNATSLVGNTFSVPTVAFDSDPSGSAMSVNTSSYGARVGVNMVRAEASQDLLHDPNWHTGTPTYAATILRDDREQDRPGREAWITTTPAFDESAPNRRLTTHDRARLGLSDEPGVAHIREAVSLDAAETADLCTFRVPPSSTVLAEWRVVARTDDSPPGRGAWLGGSRAYYREGSGDLTDSTGNPGADVTAPTVHEEGATWAIRPAMAIDTAKQSLSVHVTAPAAVASDFTAELRLTIISTDYASPSITSAVVDAGVLTISGTGLLGWGASTTFVEVFGTEAGSLNEKDVDDANGATSETEITFNRAAVAGESYVRVTANRKVSSVVAVTAP